MGIFDGIGDIAHTLAEWGGMGDDKKKPRFVPMPLPGSRTGGHPSDIHALGRGREGHGRATLGNVFPQSSKPLPKAAEKRVIQFWEESGIQPGKRPYFRVSDTDLKGTDAYTVRARGGTPVIVFSKRQAADLMRPPKDVNAQYAMATALHEMAHVAQSTADDRWVPKPKDIEPGAEAYSQLEFPGVSADTEKYAPSAADLKQMWKWRAYPEQVDNLIRRYYGRGYQGEYLPPKAWGGPSDLKNLTAYLRQGQFGYDPKEGVKEEWAMPPGSSRPYSSNFPGRNPMMSQPPKTPWGLLRWQQQGY